MSGRVTRRLVVLAAAAPLSGLASGAARGQSGAPTPVGLLVSLGGQRIPATTELIRTTGFDAPGRGAARYVRLRREAFDAATWNSLVETRFRRRDATGAWFQLAEAEINSQQFGLYGDFDDRADRGADNRDALQEMLDFAGLQGGVCRVIAGPEGGDFLLRGQVRQHSGTTLRLGEGVTIWRGFNTAGSDKGAATIINANHLDMSAFVRPRKGPAGWEAAAVDSQIHIAGPGGFDVTRAIRAKTIAGNGYAGPHVSFVGVNGCSVRGTTSRLCCREWGFHFIANNLVFSDNTATGGTRLYEDGVHIQGGRGIVVSGNHIESGDDAFAFGGSYDLAISGVTGSGNTGRSEKGHLVRILQRREGLTAKAGASTQLVANIDFAASGEAGQSRNGLVRIETDPGAPRLIRNVRLRVDARQGDSRGHDQVNGAAVLIIGGYNIAIDGTIRNPLRQAVLVTGQADRIRLRGRFEAPQTAGFQTVELRDCGEVTLSGEIACGDRAGILASNVRALRLSALTVDRIPSGYGLARLQGRTQVYSGRGVRARRAPGATGTWGFRAEAPTARVQRAGDDLTGVDTAIAPPGRR